MKYVFSIIVLTLLLSCSSDLTEELPLEQRGLDYAPISVYPICPDDGFGSAVEFRFKAKESGRLFIAGYLPKKSSVNGYLCTKNGEYVYPLYENYVEYCYFYIDLEEGDDVRATFYLTRVPFLGYQYWFGNWLTYFNNPDSYTVHQVYDKCGHQQTTYSHYN